MILCHTTLSIDLTYRCDMLPCESQSFYQVYVFVHVILSLSSALESFVCDPAY